MLTVGSLFSGIGGFDLGLERAGMRVAWQCEADEFCRRVLARHWPSVPCYPDVRELTAAVAEPIDVLCGGFPCQDISLAGKGAGIDGARSGLWGEYARLIGELRPRYVIVENVAALLSRGLGRVLGDLAALGYDAEWDCLPASAFGAPHRRDRLWLVAYPECGGRSWWPDLVGRDDSARDEAERREGASDAPRGRQAAGARSDADRGGLEVRSQLDSKAAPDPADGHPSGRHADGLRDQVADADRKGWEDAQGSAGSATSRGAVASTDDAGRWSQSWELEPDVGRVAHGVPARVDRLRGLGNALVPQIAEWLGQRILEYEGRRAA